MKGWLAIIICLWGFKKIWHIVWLFIDVLNEKNNIFEAVEEQNEMIKK